MARKRQNIQNRNFKNLNGIINKDSNIVAMAPGEANNDHPETMKGNATTKRVKSALKIHDSVDLCNEKVENNVASPVLQYL